MFAGRDILPYAHITMYCGVMTQPATPTTVTAPNRTVRRARRRTGPQLKTIVAGTSADTTFDHADTSAAIVFVDMSGYTALTEIHGDHVAAQFAEDFAVMAAEALGPGDELIKTMGDAVMIASADPTAALAFLRRLGVAAGRAEGFPMLRAGVSAGTVLRRRGDVYGTTVNVAARLVALAAPGQIVIGCDVSWPPPIATSLSKRSGWSASETWPTRWNCSQWTSAGNISSTSTRCADYTSPPRPQQSPGVVLSEPTASARGIAPTDSIRRPQIHPSPAPSSSTPNSLSHNS